MTKESPKQHLETISGSPGNQVQSCLWRHRIRKFCRILRILWRHGQLWTRFPGDPLIVSRCCLGLFFVSFFALSDGYLDKNSSCPILCYITKPGLFVRARTCFTHCEKYTSTISISVSITREQILKTHYRRGDQRLDTHFKIMLRKNRLKTWRPTIVERNDYLSFISIKHYKK